MGIGKRVAVGVGRWLLEARLDQLLELRRYVMH
jgi:hypothetical protein